MKDTEGETTKGKSAAHEVDVIAEDDGVQEFVAVDALEKVIVEFVPENHRDEALQIFYSVREEYHLHTDTSLTAPANMLMVEEVVPGFVERITALVEEESSHKRRVQMRELDHIDAERDGDISIQRLTIGIFAGLMFLCVGLAAYVGLNDHPGIAAILLGPPVMAALVAIFRYTTPNKADDA